LKRKDFDVFKPVKIEDIETDLQCEKKEDRGDIPEPRFSIGDDGDRASVRVPGYKPETVMYLFFSVRGEASELQRTLPDRRPAINGWPTCKVVLIDLLIIQCTVTI
jgi:hypothetical protein